MTLTCGGTWVVIIEVAAGYDTRSVKYTRHGPFGCRIMAETFAANAACNLKWGSTIRVERA